MEKNWYALKITNVFDEEPKEKSLLSEKLKKPNKFLIDFLIAQRMFFMAMAMMFGALFVFKGIFQADS